MSKEPATPQADGEPPSRARGANAAPSQPAGARRSRHATVQSERQAVQAALHDGAGTSTAMAAKGGHERHVKLLLPSQEGGQQVLPYPGQHQERASQGQEPPPGQPMAERPRPRPSYVPPSQRRREQPPPPYAAPPSRPAVEQPAVHGPKRIGKRKGTWTTTFWPSDPAVAHPHTPGEAVPLGGGSLATSAPAGAGSLATSGGAAPPYGAGATAPGGAPPGRVGVPNAKTVAGGSLPPREPDEYPHRQQQMEQYPRTTPTGPSPGNKGRPSPRFLPERKKKRRPAAFCFTLCCILFWFLVVGIGVTILVVYLLYHPQPPRLRVTTATLNAGYVDQLPPPRGGLALNSDLYVLATIYNPNTKIDVVMRYMQLDLFFHGVMIGTQAVWPPIHEDPGDSALRSVHLVVSEVRMSQEDAEVWHNATTRSGLVELKLRAKFHVQLNFGRWLPFRYWVYPTCSLWLDPPPAGALRRARCRK